jgi:tetratricopeptide (TPR) repeat protein
VRKRSILAAVALALCAGIPARPQSSEIQIVKGEIHAELQLLLSRQYTVEMSDVRTHNRPLTAWVETDGSFEFHNLAVGDYRIEVRNQSGDLVHQRFVTVNSMSGPISLYLPKQESAVRPGGRISVTQLKHPPSRKAYQAFTAAQKFSEAGDYPKAAGQLEKAIQESPEYAEAYTNLAVQHIRMRQFEQAMTELRRAMEISGATAVALCNLAVAETSLGRYGDALASARAAQRLDPGYAPAEHVVKQLEAAGIRIRQ